MRRSAGSRWGELVTCGWRSLTGGATWRCQLAERLGGRVWRSHLAVSVGGPAWRCHPWRSWGGAETHQHTSMRGSEGSRRGEVVTGSWRSLTGGATWRSQLADLFGGPGWRTRLAVSPVAVRVRAATDQHASVPGSAGPRWGEVVTGSWRSLVGALWLALSGWRSLVGAL